MGKKPVRIAIVEDESLMAQVLGIWILRHPDLQVVGHAKDGNAGWELCSKEQPDLALVDIELPKLDGLALAGRLLAKFPEMCLLMMSGLMDPYTIQRVSQSGVHGYLCKTETTGDLIKAIRNVAAGETFFSPIFQDVKTQWLSQPEAFQKVLSEREQEILRLVAEGANDQEIAAALNLTVSTVATHRKNIRQKLGLHNDRGMMAYARQWGLTNRKRL